MKLTGPATWPGSTPEWHVNWALEKLMPGQFRYQFSLMGGRQARGGIVVDFIIETLRLVIQVQGEYWHSSYSQQVADKMQAITMASQGYDVVYIMAEDALRDPLYYVKRALQGLGSPVMR